MSASVAEDAEPENPEREKAKKPWKYWGYRAYASFLASDDNFMIFRRFGDVHARVLLYLQDQITRLEERLDELDSEHSDKDARDIQNGSFRHESVPERTQILEQIHAKLKEYNALIIQHSTIRSHPKVPKWDITSIQTWHENTQNAIVDEEAAYIQNPYDLIPLVPKPISPLRHFLERSSRFRLARIWRKRTPEHAVKHMPFIETLQFSSDSRIDKVVGLMITVMGMVMLIAPLWVLAVTEGTMKSLGVITGFVSIFLALIAVTTVARPFESLAAAAAYAAVLVVFLQILV